MTRVPPHDLECEQAVLGAMLTRHASLEMAAADLDGDDFYAPEHGKLYDRICAVHAEGLPVDALTLGWDAKVVRDLMYATPVASHILGYAARLRDFAACRRAIALSERLADVAYAADVDGVHSLLQNADRDVSAEVLHVAPPIEASLLAAEDHTTDWVVRDLIARTEIALFVAEPGAGKTTLLNQIATCVSSGIHPFLRHEIVPRTVLVFDCQDSRGARGRSVQWMLRLAGDRYRHTLFYELRADGLDLTQRRDQRWFEAKVASVDADLLVAGPLYNMVKGAPGRGKQSEETAELAGSFLSRLVVRRNCALLIEAHAPHGDDMRVRGSKYWEDWAAFGFGLVDAKTDDGQRAFTVTRFRGDREVGRRWPYAYTQGHLSSWPWEGKVPRSAADGVTEPLDDEYFRCAGARPTDVLNF